jgi:ABC-type transport system involved in multi-copper enzyme maturation permease subunit
MRRPRNWRRILGPVFWYDLVRTSRHGQVVGHRLLYVSLLGFVLFLVYWNRFPNQSFADLFQGPRLSVSARASFAESFFYGFMGIQFLMILLLTPLYTAGAIAEEKERRTIELLFVTDLSNREIVLGMLASRLARLFLLLLAGLPILTLLAFIGGIDPDLVVIGFLGSFALMLSVGSISILASVTCRTSLGAVFSSYLQTILIVFVAPSCITPCIWAPIVSVSSMSPNGERLMLLVVGVIVSAFHGLIAFVFLRSAIFGVRSRALRTHAMVPLEFEARPLPIRRRSPVPSEEDTASRGWRPFPEVVPLDPVSPSTRRTVEGRKPTVGANALLWKEMHVEPNFGTSGPLETVWYVGGGILLFVVFLIFIAGLSSTGSGTDTSRYVQSWLRGLLLVCSFVLYLVVALSAAGRITRERERQTLDSLRTLPSTDEEILFAEWLGSILSVRRFLWMLIALWGVGILTGGISAAAVPLLIGSVVVHLGFFASLGLWFSATSKTSLRANLFTLLTTLLVLTGPGSIFSMSFAPAVTFGLPANLKEWGTLFAEYGLGPPTTLWTLTFRSADLLDTRDGEMQFARIVAALVGLHLYIALSMIMWYVARARFRALKGPPARAVQASHP